MSKTLKDCQTEVNAWVSSKADGYWNPHQIYTRLGSEVGELGKEINHEFGPLKKKPDEKPSSVVEECGDILFTVICLLNSQGRSLDEAFQKAMAKCYGRDKDRFVQSAPKEAIVEKSADPEKPQNLQGHLQYDRPRGIVYFFDGETKDCVLRIEGVPPTPEGHQIDIHLVNPGGEHHHVDRENRWADGAICAVKLQTGK